MNETNEVGAVGAVGAVGMPCVDCKQTKFIKARNMCSACYARWRRRQIAYGREPLVDVVESGVRQRVLDWMSVAEFTPRDVAQLTGLSVMVVQKIYRPDHMQVKSVSKVTAERVLSVKPAEDWGAGEIEQTKILLSLNLVMHSRDSVGIKSASRFAPSDSRNSDDGTRAHRLVRAEGTSRRLQALAVLGWSRAEIAKRTGLDQHEVIGPNMRGDLRYVRVSTARRVAVLFDELSLSGVRDQSSGDFCGKTARDAIIRGWLPPLAWDEDAVGGVGCIDDPSPEAIPPRTGVVKSKRRTLYGLGLAREGDAAH